MSAMASYCPACAESVGPIVDSTGRAICPKCLLLLADDREAVLEGTEVLFDTVLIAEDTKLIREILKDGLVAEGLADRVIGAEDGQQFIQLYTDYLYHDRTVDLAILDLQMPVLGGASTAIALRGMEKGVGAKPATIIFFTSHALTDDLRSLIRYCKPAHYLNKGADSSPPRIVKRLREVMRALKM